MKKLGRYASCPPLQLPDYTSRLSRRRKEWRFSRLLSGWPMLIDEAPEQLPETQVAEPLAPYAYRRAA